MPTQEILVGFMMLLALALMGSFVIKTRTLKLAGIPELRWAILAGLAALVSMALRGRVPTMAVAVCGDSAILLGFALLHVSLARSLDRSPRLWPFLGTLLPVYIAGLVYFSVPQNSLDGRIGVSSIGIALMLAWTARLAAQPVKPGLTVPVRWMYRLLLFLVVLRIARFALTVVFDPNPNLHVLDPLQGFLIYVGVLGSVAQAAGTFWISICSQQEHDRLRADTDGLTGLLNRRAFEELLEKQLNRASSGAIELSLLLVDLDNFKGMNDEFGHLAGDTVLRKVSGVLRRSVRSTDALARFGGDEFAVLLNSDEPGQANTVAERVRQNLIHLRHLPGGRRLTASLGVANVLPGDTPLLLMERADRALYHSKNLGKNRLTHFDDHFVCSDDPVASVMIQ